MIYCICGLITVFTTAYFVFDKKGMDIKKADFLAGFFLVSALVLRLCTFFLIRGYETDIDCFTGWANTSYALGLKEFYSGSGFVDYPPGYIYVLYLTGAAAHIFDIYTASVMYNFILKLPSIICDILTAAVIYKFAKSHTTNKRALALCIMYAFNPMIYLVSTLWGQVDSVFALFAMLALIKLYDKKHISSAVFYAIALLIKPQALGIFPVYIFYIINFVKENGWQAIKKVVQAVVSGVLVFFALLIPFSVETGFGWIFELYYNTLSSYPYATLNAPNFYGMLGANGKMITEQFLNIPYYVWSGGFIALICTASAAVYFKNKESSACFSSAAVLISGMYVLVAKMHERYIFPVVALLLLFSASEKRKNFGVVSQIFSLTSFAASFEVLMLSANGRSPWIMPQTIWFIGVSVINVATFIYMLYQMMRESE